MKTETQITPANNNAQLVEFTSEVRRLVVNGKKIPTSLWKQNPALCQSIRDKHNSIAVEAVADRLRNGYAFVKETESATGRAASIRFRKIADGGKRAEKERETIRAIQERDAYAEQVRQLKALLAGLQNKQANASALPV